MKKNKQNENKINANENGSNILQRMAFLPVMLLLAVVPLILRWNINPLSADVARYWKDTVETDLFCQTKGTVIVLLAIAMLLILFFTLDKKKIQELKGNKILMIALGVFGLLTILSVFTSTNKAVALW